MSMGSPKFVVLLPALVTGICVVFPWLGTDSGRKWYINWRYGDKEYQPGHKGHGWSTKSFDMKKEFDELDRLRQVNVQPIWDEKEPRKEK